jgi:carbon monoxide dehydrogenase subunit G
MSITKAQLKTLRTEMQAALDNAGITDFKLEVGDMSFSPTTVNIKVAGTVKSANGTVVETPADRDLAEKIAALGLKMIGPKGEKLVEYKASRYKYPFGYVTVRGARYKQSELSAKAMFG